ncbi:MAG: tRNA preQ1(34) S-adenosylmethionine ribosyltransferase-isomerase QueA [Planctomycetes bacterium]|nr:tRNA preQ1(34) S-adenosylmethionine ribosyltransferase-isomerase QueA [Planctomycetota bacterium]
MQLDELNYDLPPERIATQPAEPRDAARLMVIHRAANRIEHLRVRDLPGVLAALPAKPVMVFNRTRVLPARFEGVRRGTRGRVRGLYLASPAACEWLVMLESRGTLTPGEQVTLDADSHLELIARIDAGEWRARLHGPLDTLALLERIGATPLPPYILKARKNRSEPESAADDGSRYNTVYASDPGSVAAPTAGLHFTPELLDALDTFGVTRTELTLHVGLGTFAPVRTQRVEDHPIHSESLHVPHETLDKLRQARDTRRPLLVVGTTTARALESLPENWRDLPPTGFSADTRLFITPGNPAFAFRFTDTLMTNFHLPGSTLLALVAALPGVGVPRLLEWYRLAVRENYRFYSYGDAMLLLP